MQAHLFIFTLEVMLLVLSLIPIIALAGHTDCSWQPTQGSPESIGYRRYCKADRVGSDYKCDDSLVASYTNSDKNGNGTIEWHQPCGQGGYANNPDGSCPGAHFALCVSGPIPCYFMASGDDCEWPGGFEGSPAYVVTYVE